MRMRSPFVYNVFMSHVDVTPVSLSYQRSVCPPHFNKQLAQPSSCKQVARATSFPCAQALPVIITGPVMILSRSFIADFTARYLSTVVSEELRSVHFAIKLLCLREHS